jgi:hypothetical protein
MILFLNLPNICCVVNFLKEFECVEASNHNDIGKIIEEWQKNGWHLHTYQAAAMGAGPLAHKVNHYLLFERET